MPYQFTPNDLEKSANSRLIDARASQWSFAGGGQNSLTEDLQRNVMLNGLHYTNSSNEEVEQAVLAFLEGSHVTLEQLRNYYTQELEHFPLHILMSVLPQNGMAIGPKIYVSAQERREGLLRQIAGGGDITCKIEHLGFEYSLNSMEPPDGDLRFGPKTYIPGRIEASYILDSSVSGFRLQTLSFSNKVLRDLAIRDEQVSLTEAELREKVCQAYQEEIEEALKYNISEQTRMALQALKDAIQNGSINVLDTETARVLQLFWRMSFEKRVLQQPWGVDDSDSKYIELALALVSCCPAAKPFCEGMLYNIVLFHAFQPLFQLAADNKANKEQIATVFNALLPWHIKLLNEAKTREELDRLGQELQKSWLQLSSLIGKPEEVQYAFARFMLSKTKKTAANAAKRNLMLRADAIKAQHPQDAVFLVALFWQKRQELLQLEEDEILLPESPQQSADGSGSSGSRDSDDSSDEETRRESKADFPGDLQHALRLNGQHLRATIEASDGDEYEYQGLEYYYDTEHPELKIEIPGHIKASFRSYSLQALKYSNTVLRDLVLEILPSAEALQEKVSLAYQEEVKAALEGYQSKPGADEAIKAALNKLQKALEKNMIDFLSPRMAEHLALFWRLSVKNILQGQPLTEEETSQYADALADLADSCPEIKSFCEAMVPLEEQYSMARQQLRDRTRENPVVEKLLSDVEWAKNNSQNIASLVKVLWHTNRLIKNPQDEIQSYHQLEQEIEKQPGWGKAVAGAMVGVLFAVMFGFCCASGFGVAGLPLLAWGLSYVLASTSAVVSVVGLGIFAKGLIQHRRMEMVAEQMNKVEEQVVSVSPGT